MKLFNIFVIIAVWLQVSYGATIQQPSPLDAAIATEAINNPLTDSSSILTPSDLSQRIEQTKREQLFKFALNQLKTLAKDFFHQSETIFSDMLNNIDREDSTILNSYKIGLENYINDFYVYRSKTESSMMETLEMFSKFGGIINKFSQEQDSRMLTFLQDYGFPTFYEQTEKALKVNFNEFSLKFEEFSNNLNDFERQNEMKLLQWYQEFSQESKTFQQFQTYLKFFILFLEK